VTEIPAEEVVPGDVLLVLEGERVAADGRIVSEHGLEVDESALTGESLPVAKGSGAVAEDAPLSERTSMAYAGCAVNRGRGRIVVCATGETTELGQIERLAAKFLGGGVVDLGADGAKRGN
jgi:Ca2+-transporting ATPase